MGDRICMSIFVDSPFDETLHRGPLVLLLQRQYEFPFGINLVQFSSFFFSVPVGKTTPETNEVITVIASDEFPLMPDQFVGQQVEVSSTPASDISVSHGHSLVETQFVPLSTDVATQDNGNLLSEKSAAINHLIQVLEKP